jgi:ornithine cyclodeaminase/alanine dehydrogenase-like protein (mu-crystallin family)
MGVLVLGRAEVERLLDPDRLLSALGEAFAALSRGEVSVPPRIAATVGDAGLLAAMPGYVPSAGLGVKLVSVFPANTSRGLPSHQALICLLDPATGTPITLMDGTHITALRTAAAAALSARLLAREDARVLAIVGAGVQGAAHLTMFSLVRALVEVRVTSRSPAHAQALAAADPRAHPVDSVEDAVAGADLVALCTHSGEPVLNADWLAPGAHVTSVGFAPPHGELDRATVERGSLFVEARTAFAPPPAGCFELEGLDPASATEIGEVLLGRRPGRREPGELTVYKSMGHAVEDLAAARLVDERARHEGVGTLVDLA